MVASCILNPVSEIFSVTPCLCGFSKFYNAVYYWKGYNMKGRERFLTAIANEKPDYLPCTVHGWMGYYLSHYLGGIDQYQAYERFGMDPIIYTGPSYTYNPSDLSDWQVEYKGTGTGPNGESLWVQNITTPSGVLTCRGANNEFTGWTTEYLIKTERDFDIWSKHIPIPIKVDWSPVISAKQRIGDTGIVRGGFYDFGQGSPWQSFCTMFGTVNAIMSAIDKPQWIHHVLESMLQKKLRVLEIAGKVELDLVETGGGAGSNTVISPTIHREFCLPYDKRQHEALHKAETRIVYHLCGGVMKMLDLVVENGADGLETMTPPSMGGDCDLAKATRQVGDKIFFIGGFDQNQGFEKGIPERTAQMVRELHSACPDGGYICCPSDHFFFGDPKNIQAFVDSANNCLYP